MGMLFLLVSFLTTVALALMLAVVTTSAVRFFLYRQSQDLRRRWFRDLGILGLCCVGWTVVLFVFPVVDTHQLTLELFFAEGSEYRPVAESSEETQEGFWLFMLVLALLAPVVIIGGELKITSFLRRNAKRAADGEIFVSQDGDYEPWRNADSEDR